MIICDNVACPYPKSCSCYPKFWGYYYCDELQDQHSSCALLLKRNCPNLPDLGIILFSSAAIEEIGPIYPVAKYRFPSTVVTARTWLSWLQQILQILSDALTGAPASMAGSKLPHGRHCWGSPSGMLKMATLVPLGRHVARNWPLGEDASADTTKSFPDPARVDMVAAKPEEQSFKVFNNAYWALNRHERVFCLGYWRMSPAASWKALGSSQLNTLPWIDRRVRCGERERALWL